MQSIYHIHPWRVNDKLISSLCLPHGWSKLPQEIWNPLRSVSLPCGFFCLLFLFCPLHTSWGKFIWPRDSPRLFWGICIALPSNIFFSSSLISRRIRIAPQNESYYYFLYELWLISQNINVKFIWVSLPYPLIELNVSHLLYYIYLEKVLLFKNHNSSIYPMHILFTVITIEFCLLQLIIASLTDSPDCFGLFSHHRRKMAIIRDIIVHRQSLIILVVLISKFPSISPS